MTWSSSWVVARWSSHSSVVEYGLPGLLQINPVVKEIGLGSPDVPEEAVKSGALHGVHLEPDPGSQEGNPRGDVDQAEGLVLPVRVLDSGVLEEGADISTSLLHLEGPHNPDGALAF